MFVRCYRNQMDEKVGRQREKLWNEIKLNFFSLLLLFFVVPLCLKLPHIYSTVQSFHHRYLHLFSLLLPTTCVTSADRKYQSIFFSLYSTSWLSLFFSLATSLLLPSPLALLLILSLSPNHSIRYIRMSLTSTTRLCPTLLPVTLVFSGIFSRFFVHSITIVVRSIIFCPFFSIASNTISIERNIKSNKFSSKKSIALWLPFEYNYTSRILLHTRQQRNASEWQKEQSER